MFERFQSDSLYLLVSKVSRITVVATVATSAIRNYASMSGNGEDLPCLRNPLPGTHDRQSKSMIGPSLTT